MLYATEHLIFIKIEIWLFQAGKKCKTSLKTYMIEVFSFFQFSYAENFDIQNMLKLYE